MFYLSIYIVTLIIIQLFNAFELNTEIYFTEMNVIINELASLLLHSSSEIYFSVQLESIEQLICHIIARNRSITTCKIASIEKEGGARIMLYTCTAVPK